jgi:DMSO reductase anchor subunit
LRHADTGRATGLAPLGGVRSFERPHTEENYLLREMGFVLARKHAARLGRLVNAGIAATFAAIAVAYALPALAMAATLVAVFASLLATFVERWLFFALARHVVTLYYGGDAAAQVPASSRPAPFASS